MGAVSSMDDIAASAKLGIEQAKSGQFQTATKSRASKDEIHKAAVEFEASFLSQMFQHMFEDVGKDNMFNGGAGEESFKSFMIGEYAKLTAQTGKIGLSQQVEAQMLKMQEAMQ